MYFIFCRLQRNELSAEKSQLFQNGPVLSSTPFARQSSLQQELEAQEVPVHAHACILYLCRIHQPWALGKYTLCEHDIVCLFFVLFF